MKIMECYIFANGMVAAFDEQGNRVTECQGFILDIAEKLKTLCNRDTKWGFAKWCNRRLCYYCYGGKED